MNDIKPLRVYQTGWTIWEYFVLRRQFSYTIGGTIRSDTHDQREVLRSSVCVSTTVAWLTITHEWRSTTVKRDLKIYIYSYTDEKRVLCLDLGARTSSHYFQYRIIVCRGLRANAQAVTGGVCARKRVARRPGWADALGEGGDGDGTRTARCGARKTRSW